MSERLYYTDAYQTEFDAQITAFTTVNHQPAVVLSQSYFYPTSGGQLHDIGTLNGHPVVEVLVNEQGDVVHLLQSAWPTDQVGQTVHGKIDWARRYDHMQQHSGQHLLSQLFYQQLGIETLSVHFGTTESTLDLDCTDLTPEQLTAIETAAMQRVYAALPIKVYFVEQDGLATLPLRRAPKVSGTVRIVEIDQFDYSACGGTHCHTTAEIGPVKLIRTERRRGQLRVTFLCGQRAWHDYQQKHQLITQAAALFNNEIGNVPLLIERNLEQLRALQQTIDRQENTLLGLEAAQLLATAIQGNGYRLVQQWFTDKEVPTVKRLAQQLQQEAGIICLLGVVQAEKATLIFARSADLSLHVGNLLRDLLREAGGKGGGKEDFAQGGGISEPQGEALLSLAQARLLQQ
ncbi:MAG: hypothetical protein KF832_29760 [Caldilineaceae bacterium]|nr:hypothetical protein [Caldilineaceae bacterium]